MTILTHFTQPDGLTIHSERGWLALTPYTSQLIRVRYSLKPEFSTTPSLMVSAQPRPDVPFTVQETPNSLRFSTSAVTIIIDRYTTAFTYLDSQGGLLTKEPARGGKTLEPVDVLVSVFDEATTFESREDADGVRVESRM